MTNRELRIRRALRDDLPYYASRCLNIQPKSSGLIKLELNPTQIAVHEKIERQLAEVGRVRAIVLKARKQGVSTYTEARFFHQVTHTNGVRAKVVAHKDDSTKELFEMVRRFYDYMPDLVKPRAKRNSVRELYFDRLDSFLSVATAGSRDVGRGGTPHRLHASEFAYWQNADNQMASLVESVPEEPGTEVVLESTGNGTGNKFHEIWQKAESGKSEYVPIFIPWFHDPTYRREAAGLVPTAEERKLMRAFNLDRQQIAWRRNKINNLGPWRFLRENPATPGEAFQSGTEDPLIPGLVVIEARKRIVEPFGSTVVGIDPAREGRDRTGVIARRGPKQIFQRKFKIPDSMALIGALRPDLDKLQPDQILVDIGGLGGPIHDRLKELGYPVLQVNFGSKAIDEERFYNLRAQMWDEMREWLKTADIYDDDELQADLNAPGYDYDSNGRLKLESKESMARRGVRSPDLGDAMAMAVIGPQLSNSRKVGILWA